MTQVVVSVVVPGFNEEDKIYEALSSIAKQTLKEIEIIFID